LFSCILPLNCVLNYKYDDNNENVDDVSATYPTVHSSVTDGCILQGQNVTLTCRVTYNGTNLMPLAVLWYKYRKWGYVDQVIHMAATNASSLFQSSLTFTASGRITDSYTCRIGFLPPTGIVLPGVREQSSLLLPDRGFTSSQFASRRVASERSLVLDTIRCARICNES